jgi:hypothetical protein
LFSGLLRWRRRVNGRGYRNALEILLVLLEEASRAIEYVDDSDGELGGFIGELGLPLAEAILSMELGPVERERLVRRLEELILYADNYGMGDSLDIAIQAAKFGWREVPKEVEGNRRTVSKLIEEDEQDDWDEDDEWDEEAGYEIRERRWPAISYHFDLTEAKLNVLDRQGRAEDYLALCEKEQRHLRYALKLCDLG